MLITMLSMIIVATYLDPGAPTPLPLLLDSEPGLVGEPAVPEPPLLPSVADDELPPEARPGLSKPLLVPGLDSIVLPGVVYMPVPPGAVPWNPSPR